MDEHPVFIKMVSLWDALSFTEKASIIGGFFITLFVVYIVTKPTKEQRLKRELQSCWKDLTALIKSGNCNPILLRLGWSDAMTYDSAIPTWPYCGGVNGSVRLDYELALPANSGLSKAVSLLTPIKRRHRSVSWADLIQMAAVVSVYTAGGPLIELDYGRVDAPSSMYDSDEEEDSTKANSPVKRRHRYQRSSGSQPNGKVAILPQANPPYPDGAPSADVHIRNIFYRLGLNNRDTVALCGAHTLGRAFQDRSGVCPFSSGDQGSTLYTKPTAIARADGEEGVGMAGGCSWTKQWLRFDNSYYQRIFDQQHLSPQPQHTAAHQSSHHGTPHSHHSHHSSHSHHHASPAKTNKPFFPEEPVAAAEADELLWLPTDQALYDCPEYRTYFLRYANSQEEWFKDFAASYKKLSELGAKFRHVIQLSYPKQ